MSTSNKIHNLLHSFILHLFEHLLYSKPRGYKNKQHLRPEAAMHRNFYET